MEGRNVFSVCVTFVPRSLSINNQTFNRKVYELDSCTTECSCTSLTQSGGGTDISKEPVLF